MTGPAGDLVGKREEREMWAHAFMPSVDEYIFRDVPVETNVESVVSSNPGKCREETRGGSRRNMFMMTPAVVKEIWVNTGGVGSCSGKRRLMSCIQGKGEPATCGSHT